ncbi:MAG: SUMF1/EgtB/PvdO family nonheme iron enzyme [Planctomycetota bacterium]
MFCFSCGTQLPDNARFCVSCGVNLQPVQKYVATVNRDRAAAASLLPAESMGGSDVTISQAPQAHVTRTIGPGSKLCNSRYTVIDELGRGGMGVVFRVADGQMQGREFAFKSLPPGMTARPELLEDVRGEVATAQALRHPNVVGVYDLVDDMGDLFIKMELVVGSSLRALQKNRQDPRIPLDEALGWIRQACDGLGYAHSEFILHRDVKPDNLLLSVANNRVMVADFGLATMIDSESSHLSLGGLQMGTYAYMPPEQFAGTRVSRRSDIYSLGATLYTLLNGKPPFAGRRAIHDAILFGTPDPIAGIPDWLNQVLLQCMSKHEAARPGSMDVLKSMLASGDVRTATTIINPATAATAPPAPGSNPDVGSITVAPPSDAQKLNHGEFTLVGRETFRCGQAKASVAVYRSEHIAGLLGAGAGERAIDAEFVLLPVDGLPPEFVMGSPANEPERAADERQRTVRIGSPFLIARTACSRRVAIAAGASAPDGDGMLPVTGLDWRAVNQMCRLMGLRLPSEAEWEFACRATTTGPFCFGDEGLSLQINFDGTHPLAGGSTSTFRNMAVPVGSLPPNAFGLHEMHGNVGEWVLDVYAGDTSLAPDNGAPLEAPDAAHRVVRGGSWLHVGAGVRSASRHCHLANRTSNLIGFRPAVSVW